MSRALRVLAVASVLIVWAALAAAVIWWASAHQLAFQYVLGVGLVALGAGCTALHFTLSDGFLGRHLGEPGAAQTRRFCRGGWVGVVLGAAILGFIYLDRWVNATAAEAQFNVTFNRGISAARDGDWRTAAEAFSEAVRLNPNDARPYRNRAAAYLHQGEIDRALADLEEALRLAPDDARTVYNRGVAYVRKNDPDRALADFGEAICLDPNYAKAYLARGWAYHMKGDDARARADWRKAFELDPSLEIVDGPPL